jgi:hypothetical protein
MRRFPPPWTIEEHNNACCIVKDATGQALGYFYFEDEPGRRSAAKLLTRTRRGGWQSTSAFTYPSEITARPSPIDAIYPTSATKKSSTRLRLMF